MAIGKDKIDRVTGKANPQEVTGDILHACVYLKRRRASIGCWLLRLDID